MVALFVAALIDVRIWYRYAYLGYFAVLALLVAVEVAGSMGMGAQRWIDLKVIQLQPSEIMKVALVLALARYFHGVAEEDIGRPSIPRTVLCLQERRSKRLVPERAGKS